MSTPFRSRDPLPIGIAGLAAIALVLLAAFNASALPLIGGGEDYSASFSEAGGLRSGDEVRIAGVRVGKVKGIRLAGNKVDVDFRITEDVAFGPESGASIRMKTLLGQKYVSLEPRGRGQMTEGTTIPISRTVSSLRHHRRLLGPHRDHRADRHRPGSRSPSTPSPPSSRTRRPTSRSLSTA